ncbi:hypothetical protein CFIMG_000045RA [Ceratocystis fimbriata CBS 114723]|uniref:Uncharacterized protein n=1 Tax=Ceratocystis fimbriata CBS 114723 TaxID=1035309 RepID=A0A2C5XD82_9PEZI|nr:hypothetical protein CFIMG_000045RA [Ceratocystis fimbriata CBS 114723]
MDTRSSTSTMLSAPSVVELNLIPQGPSLAHHRLARWLYCLVRHDEEDTREFVWCQPCHRRLHPRFQLLLRWAGLSCEMTMLGCGIYMAQLFHWNMVLTLVVSVAAIPCSFWELICLSSLQIPRFQIWGLAVYETSILMLVQIFACGHCLTQAMVPSMADSQILDYSACRPYMVGYSVLAMLAVLMRLGCCLLAFGLISMIQPR